MANEVEGQLSEICGSFGCGKRDAFQAANTRATQGLPSSRVVSTAMHDYYQDGSMPDWMTDFLAWEGCMDYMLEFLTAPRRRIAA